MPEMFFLNSFPLVEIRRGKRFQTLPVLFFLMKSTCGRRVMRATSY